MVKITLFFSRGILFFGALAVALSPAHADAAAADRQSPVPIVVPQSLGIASSVEAPSLNANPSSTRLILIQDIHADPGAQRNLAGILDMLVREHGLKLVMLEGGWGDVNVDSLGEYVPGSIREQVASEYLDTGMLTGEEYFQIVSDQPIELWGVDQEALYKEHYRSYLEVQDIRRQVGGALLRLKDASDVCLDAVMNDTLADFERRRLSFARGTASLKEYVDYLAGQAKASGLPAEAYANLRTFVEVVGLEDGLEQEAVQEEQAAVLKRIHGALPKGQSEAIPVLVKQLKEGGITQTAFVEEVRRLAASTGVDISAYAHFARYAEYLERRAQIDYEGILTEIGALEQRLQQALIKTDRERALIDVRMGVETYRALVALEWTPEDFARYREHAQNWRVAAWAPLIEKAMADRGERWWLGADAASIDASLDKAISFYRLAQERDGAIARAVVDKLQETDSGIAALIVGGFHSKGITRLLAAKGIPVTVVTPRTGDESEDLYARVLKARNFGLLSGREFKGINSETDYKD